MVLLGAAFMSHGAIAFDGNKDSASTACRERFGTLSDDLRGQLSTMYTGLCSTANALADLNPDVVIIHTPHGISLADTYGVYVNSNAEGSALWNGQWTEFAVKVTMDSEKAQKLVDQLKSDGVSVQAIRSFANTEAPLRWGEVIPVWYLQQALHKEVKYIVVTQDSKAKPSSLEDWQLDIGKGLAKFAEGLAERVVVVVSGDLSHFHPTTCTNHLYLPDPRVTTRFSVSKEGAMKFERAVMHWVKSTETESSDDYSASEQSWSPEKALPWLRAIVEADPGAGSCGGRGLAVLHGLLSAAATHGGTAFRSHLYSYAVPTYFGMMSATFLRQ